MTGLDKITEKIISEANDNARATIESARKRCIEISNEYAARAEKFRTSLGEDAEKEAAAIISQSKSGVEVERRNSLLKVKNDLIGEAFAQARRELENLPEEKYCMILSSFAAKALSEIVDVQEENLRLYGEEPDADTFELLLSGSDLEKYGKSVYDGLCKKVSEKYGKGKKKKIILSKTPAKIDGGVVIKCGSVENNCSFSVLFSQLRDRLEKEVAHYLFEDSRDSEN